MISALGTLDETQRARFSELLRRAGLNVGEDGHIDVAEPLSAHPERTPNGSTEKNYLPVGFIERRTGKVMLVNIELNFPRDYHKDIREKYTEVIK